MGGIQVDELLKSLKSLLEEGDYSDLKIVSSEKSYRLHKALVCPRSTFFDAACNSGLQEARTGIINLPDDDPQAVDLMVHYFYTLDYPHVFLHTDKKCDDNDETIAIADTQPVEESAEDHFWGKASKKNKKKAKHHKSSHAIFQEDQLIPEPDTEPAAAIDPEAVPNLILHAKVYSLAEKYSIEGLKALAVDKFKDEMQRHYDTDDFVQAAREAYVSTVETDRGLRDLVVETVFNHKSMLDSERGKALLKDTENLAYDVLMYLKNCHRIYWP